MIVPKVSILLPVYSSELTVGASVQSLLNQTYSDFECIIIDDGSKDSSWDVVKSFDDPRIRRFRQNNIGLAPTLNKGISLARGEYIARLDHDDLAMPDRLAKQVEFLDKNVEVAVLGTWAEIYEGDQPSGRFHRHALSADALRLELLVDNPFVHASVMFRADVIRSCGGYLEGQGKHFPEDYELWSRVARVHDVANLPDVLTIYREVQGSITRVGGSHILSNVVRISAANLKKLLGEKASDAECLAFSTLYHGTADETGRRLCPSRSLEIWRDAAVTIAGLQREWPEEYSAVYVRGRRHLRSRSVQRYMPPWLLKSARLLKSRIGRWGKAEK